MKKILESLFKLSEFNTNVKQEAIGGTKTFMTVIIILFAFRISEGIAFGFILYSI